jgi:hypothetical protein
MVLGPSIKPADADGVARRLVMMHPMTLSTYMGLRVKVLNRKSAGQ